MRGPTMRPARCSSAAAKIDVVSFEGSWMVVTPKARLENCCQFCSGVISERAMAPWAWTSTRPGMMVLPPTSMMRASAGTSTSPAGPTASIRLPCTTTTPFSITSRSPSRAPRMVTTRAPLRARRPLGLSAATVKDRSRPSATGSGSSSGAPSRKAKASFSSRV